MPPNPPPPPVFTLRTDGGAISSVSFLHDENKLISGCSQGIITIWCLKSFRRHCTWNSHEEKGILWVGNQNKTIYSQGRDGFIRKHEFHESQWVEVAKIPFAFSGFCMCNINSSSNVIAVPEENRIRFLSMKDMTETFDLQFPEDMKKGMCMCLKSFNVPDSSLMIGFEDGSISIWDIRYLKKSVDEYSFYNDPVMCLDYDSTLKKGICGSSGDKLHVWSFGENGFKMLETLTLTNSGIAAVKMRKDQKIFASGGWDGRLRIFGLKRIRSLAVLNHHIDTVQCLEFSDSSIGKYNYLLAAGSKDKWISIWNLF